VDLKIDLKILAFKVEEKGFFHGDALVVYKTRSFITIRRNLRPPEDCEFPNCGNDRNSAT